MSRSKFQLKTNENIIAMRAAGLHAFLVGEAFMR